VARHNRWIFAVTTTMLMLGVLASAVFIVLLLWMWANSIVVPTRVTMRASFDRELMAASPATVTLAIIVGLFAAGLVLSVLLKILAIVRSVDDGDPFTRKNSDRLRAAGWLLLLAFGVVISTRLVVFGTANMMTLAPTCGLGLMSVMLLFVVAHVFDAGLVMRSDLDGTI
jgi:hypothetical protein